MIGVTQLFIISNLVLVVLVMVLLISLTSVGYGSVSTAELTAEPIFRSGRFWVV